MTKNINTVFVQLTTAQQAKVPANLIKAGGGNRKYLMIADLKSVASSLANELLAYADVTNLNATPAGLPEDANLINLYHVVPSQFVTSYKGFKDAANQLNAVQTTDGRWVCSFNTIYEFWDYFGGQTIQLVQLSYTDFPQTPKPSFKQ